MVFGITVFCYEAARQDTVFIYWDIKQQIQKFWICLV